MIIPAKIIKVTTRNFIIIDHYGIMIIENGEPVVYHNDSTPENKVGGNVLRQTLAEFMEGREYQDSEQVWIDANKFYNYVNQNLLMEYNLRTYNCEDFVNEALYGVKSSPQLRNWTIGGIVAGVGIIGLIRYNLAKRKVA